MGIKGKGSTGKDRA
jgi:hypothetical protein